MIGPSVRFRSVSQSAGLFVSFLLEVELLEDVVLVAEFAVGFSLLLVPLEERHLPVRGVLPRLKGDEVGRGKNWIGK